MKTTLTHKLGAIAAASLLALGLATSAQAQSKISGDTIKIGIITDIGGLYSDIGGNGSVEAIRLAIADAGGNIGGKKIELLFADHQNKADVASSKAREWFDTQGVDMLIGGTNSATALAMAKVAEEKKKIFIPIGAGSARLTNEACSPYTIHYAYDTVAMAKGTGATMVKTVGKNWYFLTADYAFGQSLQDDTATVVKGNGGTVVGSVKHPLSASDFSSFLLQAQNSKAQVLGLANAGGDLINSIKAANEFGITKTMKMAALLMFINDIHALGLKNTEGLYLTDAWYWNQSPESREWARRFFEKVKRMPSMVQAGDYSATAFYLKGVKATGTDDADTVMKWLKSNKINDMFAKGGYVREDGRMIHDMYLMQVKSQADSKEPWDYMKLVSTIPGEQAFTTRAESRCSLMKK
ncbi:MAG: ABC transporter substrate-binding protein [Burkholderiaceae bacterium]